MDDLLLPILIVGIGLVLLVILLLTARGPVRRFARASAAARSAVTERVVAMREEMNSRSRSRERPSEKVIPRRPAQFSHDRAA